MHFVKKQASEKRQHFADQLKTGKLLRFPGAYNPLVAKLIGRNRLRWSLCFWWSNGQ